MRFIAGKYVWSDNIMWIWILFGILFVFFFTRSGNEDAPVDDEEFRIGEELLDLEEELN